jgi:hypothetical protein
MGIVDALISPGGGIATLIDDVVRRVWQDPTEAQKAKDQMLTQMAEMRQKGELAYLDAAVSEDKARLQVVDDEAKNPNLWVSGAHAGVEWVSAVGLAYQIVVRPFIVWGSLGWWHVPPPPSLDMGTLLTLLGMLLGSGTLRIANAANARSQK